MIIVEGPDGAGKTNLIRRLSETFIMPIERRVVDKNTNALQPLKEWVMRDMDNWPRAALYDRHRLISEPIYAPLVRSKLADGFDEKHWFKQALKKFYDSNPIIIYCLPPFEIVHANVLGDVDNEAIAELIDAIYWLYHAQVARDTALFQTALVWDYTKDNYNELLLKIYQRIMAVKTYYGEYYPLPSYRGSVAASNRQDAGW